MARAEAQSLRGHVSNASSEAFFFDRATSVRVGDLVRDHHLHGLAGVAPPGERGAEKLRMQRGGVERHPQQRHLGGEQAPSEFIEAGNAVGEFARLRVRISFAPAASPFLEWTLGLRARSRTPKPWAGELLS